MSAAFVSEAGVPVYDEIADYVSGKLGEEVEFVSGFGYATINGMLESGAVDVGFVCGLPYVLLHDRDPPPVHLLAAPVMKAARYQGKPKYYSDLIVGRDSEIQTLHDLRGRTYAFNEELSNSGYNMPRWRLLELGLRDGFFGKVVRSGSHEESISMVADGRADGSFVDSLVLEYDRAHGLGGADRVRVVESVGPAGIPPVVVSDKVPPDLRERLQGVLLRMHEDPRGQGILNRALVARFVEVGDDNYDDIRTMMRRAEDTGFRTIH
ncbi:MAG: PhnD/SsuA/transferrin family substrate-binding protein [Myxococcota bacterium]